MPYSDLLIKTVLQEKYQSRESGLCFASPLIVDGGFVDKSVEIFSEVLSRKEKEIHV
jgi:hypothetical protein